MASLATLRADVWNTLFTSITAASTTTSIVQHTNAFPDLKDGNPSFPILIIDNPRPARTLDNNSTSGNNVSRDTEIELTLYCKKGKQVDTISDALLNYLETNKDTIFTANNLFQVEMIDGGHTTFYLEDTNKLHEKVILLRFVCLL